MFGSKANSELVSYILSKKLYDYLANANIVVEMKNGEVILEASMPPLNIVDRCDISLKMAPSYLKGVVKSSTYLKAGGEFNFNDQDPFSAAIFHGHVDFETKLRTKVFARLGKPFFKRCLTKLDKEMPLNLKAHGKAFVSVKVVTSNVRIERRIPNQIERRTLDLDLNGNFISLIVFAQFLLCFDLSFDFVLICDLREIGQ